MPFGSPFSVCMFCCCLGKTMTSPKSHLSLIFLVSLQQQQHNAYQPPTGSFFLFFIVCCVSSLIPLSIYFGFLFNAAACAFFRDGIFLPWFPLKIFMLKRTHFTIQNHTAHTFNVMHSDSKPIIYSSYLLINWCHLIDLLWDWKEM